MLHTNYIFSLQLHIRRINCLTMVARVLYCKHVCASVCTSCSTRPCLWYLSNVRFSKLEFEKMLSFVKLLIEERSHRFHPLTRKIQRNFIQNKTHSCMNTIVNYVRRPLPLCCMMKYKLREYDELDIKFKRNFYFLIF